MKAIAKIFLLMLLSILIGSFEGYSQDIFAAIEQGDALSVQKILTDNPQLLNLKNPDAKTPLNFAAEKGNAEITGLLLEMGADPLLGDRENSMPVHLAAISGNKETIDIILGRGIDIDSRDDNGMTPLHFALAYRQGEMARYLITKGADVKAPNNGGLTPLHYAAIRGDLESARMLVERKADVNSCMDGGMTPVFSAASFGHLEMVKFLVENGARLDTETDEGGQILSYTLNPNTYDVVKYLVEKGLDVKHRDKNRITPLHEVASRGTALNVAQLLIDHGADINAVSTSGQVPLTFAAYSRNADGMSKFLILNGAEVNPDPCKLDKACTCGPNISRPLHMAVRMKQLAMARNLVSNGAMVNVYDNQGMTPLHYAAQGGDFEIVQYLVDHGAFLNTGDKEQGCTELHHAAYSGNKDLAAWLIEKGSCYKATDHDGRTPLDYALYYRQEDVAYAMLSAGADDGKLKEYVNAPCPLGKPLGQGQAVVWFLGHSGWAIRTQNHLLVFDYFVNPMDPKPADTCLASGFICPAELKDQNVTVFSTHSHQDHFDPRIFGWKATIPGIEYVLCWEPAGVQEAYEFIPVKGQKNFDGMKVSTTYSTDMGGGYLVEVDGLVIWHMGDLANGEDKLMEAFAGEIDRVAGMGKPVDILFGPIRGCGLGQPEQVEKGLYYTLDKLDPGLFVPMHAGGHSFEYKKFAEAAHEDGMTTDFKYVIHKGDRFVYDKNGDAEVVTAF